MTELAISSKLMEQEAPFSIFLQVSGMKMLQQEGLSVRAQFNTRQHTHARGWLGYLAEGLFQKDQSQFLFWAGEQLYNY